MLKSTQCSTFKQLGFTLVEMMVVVAILGVLAAVAVPNYRRYVARSRQVEAKTKLTSIYQLEKAYYTNNNTYTSCLKSIGFAQESGARSYYSAGFSFLSAGNNYCGPLKQPLGSASPCTTLSYNLDGTPGTSCILLQEICSAANSAADGTPFPCVMVPGYPTHSSFVAGAGGNIAASMTDLWSINESKELINTIPP